MKEFPTRWKKLKKIKAIIDRWGETVNEDCPHFPSIFDKFLDTYFTPGVNIKVRNLNIFQPMFASRPYLKIFGTRFTKKILDVLATHLKVDQLIDASEEKFSIANEYLYKISLFYSTKIPVQEIDKTADAIYILYQNFGHCLPILHIFRTWVIQNSNISRNNLNPEFLLKLSSDVKKQLPDIVKLLKGY